MAFMFSDIIGIFIQRWLVYVHYINRVDSVFMGTIYQTKKWCINVMSLGVSMIIAIFVTIIGFVGYQYCDDYLISMIMVIFGLFDLICIVYTHVLLISKLVKVMKIKYSLQLNGLIVKLIILMVNLSLSNNIFIILFIVLGYDIFYLILGIDLIINNIILMLSFIKVEKMYIMCCMLCIKIIPNSMRYSLNNESKKPLKTVSPTDSSTQLSILTLDALFASQNKSFKDISSSGSNPTIPKSSVFNIGSHILREIQEDKQQTPKTSIMDEPTKSTKLSFLNPPESPTLTYTGNQTISDDKNKYPTINKSIIINNTETDSNSHNIALNISKTVSFTKTFDSDLARASNIKTRTPPIRPPRINTNTSHTIPITSPNHISFQNLINILSQLTLDFNISSINSSKNSIKLLPKTCILNLKHAGLIN